MAPTTHEAHRMDAVTADTNIFPIADIKDLVAIADYSLEVVSVTNRELQGTDLSEAAGELNETLETFHFGEGGDSMTIRTPIPPTSGH